MALKPVTYTLPLEQDHMLERVGVREASAEAYTVKWRGGSFSADLGCSSK